MATAGGPNIERDGLVFGYDTGYGVADNNTATRFYSGEPTINILNNNIVGTGNGASLGSDDFGTYIQLADQTTSYSRFQIPTISVSSNETYTWSFELYSEDTILQSGNYLFDTNEYSDQFPASNDLSRLSTSQDRPSILPARVWTPFRLTVTMKDNLTGAYSYDFFNMYYPGFQNKKIYYRNMQFERNKSHKTPYVGQGGTRSATQSLLDLTKSTTIDVSNVSFDSTGQPTFDGTDDHITGTLPINGNGAPHTIEMVFSSNVNQGSLGGRRDPFTIGNSTTHQYSALDVNASYMNWYFYSRDTTFTNSPQMVANQFYHIILSYAGGASNNTNKKVWFNGVQQTLSAGSSETSLLPDNPSFSVGRDRGRNTAYWPGEIPVFKVYNRALSEEEALSNFKAYKNRFNI